MRSIIKQFVANVLMVVCLGASLFAQNSSDNKEKANDDAVLRANEIIKEYLTATGAGKMLSKEGLKIHFEFSWQAASGRLITVAEEFSLLDSDKLRWDSKNHDPGSLPYHLISILNGEKYQKRYDSSSSGTAPPQSIVRNVKISKKEQGKDNDTRLLRFKAFQVFYPIIMEASWYPAIAYRYIGSAELKDKKVDVLEAELSKDFKYRLLFDKASHLLLRMRIVNKKINQDFYFSDYKKISGLLLAHKVEMFLNGKINDQRKLVGLEIKPDFSKKHFDVFGK